MDHGIRVLALNVIWQALVDVVSPRPLKKANQRTGLIQDAKEFFFSPDAREDLIFWCRVAGVDPKDVDKKAKQVFDSQTQVGAFPELGPDNEEDEEED